ncbi:MAG: response regulator [Deltaproteobacteria bacterium]|nr:response regulator [Deltaproteobacteria bacterium]
MFVILAFLIEGAIAISWIFVLRPHIEADIESKINALAQTQSAAIEEALSGEKIDKESVLKAIDNLFLLKDAETEIPFVSGVELFLDYDALNVPEGSLDIKRWQLSEANNEKENFYNVEIALFSTRTRELLGIAQFSGSRYSFEFFEKKVRNTFFIATLATMVLLLAAWLVLLFLLKPLNLLAESLSSRTIQHIEPLDERYGRFVSSEIRLVHMKLNELLTKINEYTREQETLNTILSTQQETSIDGIIVVDDEGRILTYNRRFIDMWRLSDNVMHRGSGNYALLNVRDKILDPSDFLSQIKYFTENPGEKGFQELELKDGSIFECYSSPMKGGDDNFFGRVWYFRDITKSKNLESQLNQARKMESIGTLAGGIAHDFNNILGIILGNADLTKISLEGGEPVEAYIDEIRTACFRAKKMVEQILVFSRKSDQEFLPISINKVIEESVKLIRSTIPSTISISLNLSDKEDIITGDSTQISQVMLNLCVNSAHAMRETGGTLDISVSGFDAGDKSMIQYYNLPEGKYVEIKVGDTGHGIHPDILGRIFDPYFTTKGVGEGSGMGLAVVHGIVTGHNGRIRVESAPGKGTVVRMVFPAVYEQPIIENDSVDTLFRGTEKILIADDEKSITLLLTHLFERLGYSVTAGNDPVEVYKVFENDPNGFDLLLTDMSMPRMTGADLIRKIKAIRPDMPVILCTGYSDMMDEQKAVELDVSSFVLKPLALYNVAETVRKILDSEK